MFARIPGENAGDDGINTDRWLGGSPAKSTFCVCYILKTPNFVSAIGAFRAADKASATTRRVSPGAMMPSSHRRAVA